MGFISQSCIDGVGVMRKLFREYVDRLRSVAVAVLAIILVYVTVQAEFDSKD